MPVTSAGLLLYRDPGSEHRDPGPEHRDRRLEVLIAHMGGPFWARKDEGAWSIPKGEYDPGSESAADAAAREFREELGVEPPAGPYLLLGEFAYASGKRVTVFAADGAGLAASGAASGFVFGEFEMEWPPRSGRIVRFPEVDRAEWMPLGDARPRLVKGQRAALDRLEELLRETR